MKFVKLLILLMAAALLLAACRQDEDIEEPETPTPPPIEEETPFEGEVFTFTQENFPRMDGSPATEPLAQAIAAVMLGQAREAFEDLTIFTRTTQAFRNLAAGHSDILIVAEPTPYAFDDLRELGFEIDIEPIATDALVFIVNASNPVDSLTSEQIIGIYTGEITNWLQVGGENLEIIAFQRNEEAGSQVMMEKLVMDWQRMSDAPVQSFQAAHGLDEPITAIKGFDGSPNAIGYTMFYYAVNMEMAEGLKIIALDGVKASKDTIASGEYPFINPYYAVIRADEPEDNPARIMFNWLLSDDGQSLIELEGYVSIRSGTLSGLSQVQPHEMRWSVELNIDHLLPYAAPRSMSIRLQDTSLSELVPSANYGVLLPYSSAVTMNDGSIRVTRFGFVSQDGVVVTDPVYDNIVRATYFATHGSEPRPAYHLFVNLPEPDPYHGIQALQAASALDGSWITPFDYVNIVFTDEVILLMRDHETFDIDVYDYSGRLLYNIAELEWADDISEDTWAEVLVYSVSEGYGFVRLNNGIYGVMDVLTGSVQVAEFDGALSFSEGLAAVIPSGQQLWGFIDKDLEIVIPPGFVREAVFVNDRAFVETPDGRQHIINKQGEALFSITEEHFIVQNHDAIGFSVHMRREWDYPRLYTSDFNEIEYPAGATLIGPESDIRYLRDGWYTLIAEEGVWLFNGIEAYRLPSNRYINDFVGGYIIYIEVDQDFAIIGYGVMTPDGQEIIPSEGFASISPAIENGTAIGFILNSSSPQGDVIRDVYTTAVYTLVNYRSGANITGSGILAYDEASELFHVQGTDYFAWLDAMGNKLLSIPSMAYTFD